MFRQIRGSTYSPAISQPCFVQYSRRAINWFSVSCRPSFVEEQQGIERNALNTGNSLFHGCHQCIIKLLYLRHRILVEKSACVFSAQLRLFP